MRNNTPFSWPKAHGGLYIEATFILVPIVNNDGEIQRHSKQVVEQGKRIEDFSCSLARIPTQSPETKGRNEQ